MSARIDQESRSHSPFSISESSKLVKDDGMSLVCERSLGVTTHELPRQRRPGKHTGGNYSAKVSGASWIEPINSELTCRFVCSKRGQPRRGEARLDVAARRSCRPYAEAEGEGRPMCAEGRGCPNKPNGGWRKKEKLTELGRGWVCARSPFCTCRFPLS